MNPAYTAKYRPSPRLFRGLRQNASGPANPAPQANPRRLAQARELARIHGYRRASGSKAVAAPTPNPPLLPL